jgi:hypothetical protein
MRISTRWADTTLTVELHPEGGDSLERGRARLTGTLATFRLPVALGPGDLHPDVEALLALLIVQPFCGPSVTVARGVSAAFAAAVGASLRKTVAPIDPSLAPRERPTDGRVGLAYSAGADSTAALAVLPPDTVLFFLRRVDPPGPRRRTLYSDAAALHACAELEKRGRQVRVVESDVEYIRDPVGFTADWINGAGAILLADHERIDSLGWGLIAESAYGIGHEHFLDWRDRQGTGWGPVFAAAGLPMCQAVAGVSEVGTASIVRRAPDGDLAQSCIRGAVGAPCRNCWKCFRKSLLDAALAGEWPSPGELDRLFRVPEARGVLAKYPIRHEDVVAWTAGRYRGRHRLMRLLAARTWADRLELDWLTRFYGPSMDLLPERHRAVITANLEGYLDRMTAQDESAMRAWDMHAMLADPATEASRDALIAALQAHGSSDGPRVMALARRIRRRLGA